MEYQQIHDIDSLIAGEIGRYYRVTCIPKGVVYSGDAHDSYTAVLTSEKRGIIGIGNSSEQASMLKAASELNEPATLEGRLQREGPVFGIANVTFRDITA